MKMHKLKQSNRIIHMGIYGLSFLISAMGMILILKSRGFYPFKGTTLFFMDMRDQYVGFFASLRYLFSGEGSLFFSWSRSMGGNYLGLFAYYIASPLSFITVFFPLKDMPLAIVVLSVLKIGLCGLSFSVYASWIWEKHGVGGAWTRLLVIPFSVAYALTAYNIAYLLCLMWLDGVILLPCILLGVEKMMDGQKGLHYVLCLTALFYCNYYTGYMVGIFIALYVALCVASRWDRRGLRKIAGILWRLAGATLLSLGLAAPMLLSVIRELLTGRLTVGAYESGEIYNFQPFSKLLMQFTHDACLKLDNGGLPFVYCGYAALAFALLFFLLPRIAWREKLGVGCLITLLSLSFYFRAPDRVWHGFLRPVCFPYRYAFLLSFVLLYMAVRAASRIPWDRLADWGKRFPLFEGVVVILMLVTAMDLGSNGRDTLFAIANAYEYTSVEEYETFLNATQPLISSIKEGDRGLYRINQNYEYSKNDAMLLGYNGMTHYSSTFNRFVNQLMPRLGIAQDHFWNAGYGSTPLTDSLFGVKYVLTQRPVPSFYTALQESGVAWEEDALPTASYRNDYALPMIYTAPVSALSPDLSGVNPFDNQTAVLNGVAGTDHVFFAEYECDMSTGTTLPAEDSGAEGMGRTYIFTAVSDEPIYLYLVTEERYRYPKKVYVNGVRAGDYFNSETSCILYLGTFEAGREVKVEMPEQAMDPERVLIARLNTDLLRETLAPLCANGLDITRHRGGTIVGTVTVPEGETIVTSIPYDEGWTVRVDGRKVAPTKFADTFLVIPAGEGEHVISLSYVSPGFGAGVLLCAAALVLGVGRKGRK